MGKACWNSGQRILQALRTKALPNTGQGAKIKDLQSKLQGRIVTGQREQRQNIQKDESPRPRRSAVDQGRKYPAPPPPEKPEDSPVPPSQRSHRRKSSLALHEHMAMNLILGEDEPYDAEA